MRWQRPARVLVALVGLGCAATLFVYGRARQRPAAIETKPVLTDHTVTAQQHGAIILRTNLNKDGEALKIESAESTTFDDGRVRHVRAHFTTTRANGTTFETWAGIVEGQGKAITGDEPGLIVLSNGVRTRSDDGLEMTTASATYDNIQGLATIPGPLTFTRGRLKGDGVGATYDRQRDVLWLVDQAHVARAAGEDGSGAIDARAQGIGLARADRYMNLRGQATVVQPEQTLDADQIVVHFTEDERGATLVEMHGNARVTPTGGRARAAGVGKAGAPDLHASEITLEFQSDGQTLRHAMLVGKSRMLQTVDQGRQTISAETIDVVTGADGRTLTSLEARGAVEVLLPPSAEAPDRTIHAETLVTSGDEAGGLKSAVFDGGIRFVEKGTTRPAPRGGARPATVDREATSATLALALGGQLGAIQKAEFRRNVAFKDGGMQAGADVAVHDQIAGTLELTPATGAKTGPWMDDGSVRVDAMWILVAMGTHDVRASDRVRFKMTPGNTRTAALFDGAQPVYGLGAALQYVNATKEATFAAASGAEARVYQMDTGSKGNSPGISATERIVIDQATGDLRANGQVNSNFVLEKQAEPGPRGRATGARASGTVARGPAVAPATSMTVVKGAEMVYSDATRQVTYRGDGTKPAELRGPDDNVEAQEIVLTLAKDERALKTLVATGAMSATFDGGRETIGDRLVYDVEKKTHVITGRPLHFKNVQTDAGQKSCSVEKSTELIYDDRDQTISEPGSDSKALRASTQVACDKPLKTLIIK